MAISIPRILSKLRFPLSVALGGTGVDTAATAPFTLKPYVSSQLTITAGGTLSLTHGLGVKPSQISFSLICITADTAAGYAVNDEISMVGFNATNATTTDRGVTFWYSDTTTVSLRYGATATTFAVLHKTAGTFVSLVNANWKMIVRIHP